MADWRDNAACEGEDTETFFPPADENENRPPSLAARAAAMPAKEICRDCPVISECLTWAMESGQRFGVFGGRTAYERRQLRRNRITPIPTVAVRRGRRRAS